MLVNIAKAIDGGIILVPKKKYEWNNYDYTSGVLYHDKFQFPKSQNIDQLKQAQDVLRQELPVVIAGYVLPIDSQGNTMLQWSNVLSIGKAFGGKGPEAALVQCLADAYARIGARTLKSLRGMIDHADIDRHSLIRLIHYKASLFDTITDEELTHWIKIITGVYNQDDAIRTIQELAHKNHLRPLLTYWLQLNKKATRIHVIKVLGRTNTDMMSKEDKITSMYNELLLFTPENYRSAAVREFGEETGYADLDPDKLIHFYTASEIKTTLSGNNYLKHRHYYFYTEDLGVKGATKFSPSEVDQQLKTLSGITFAQANEKQKQGIIEKVAIGNMSKMTTAVANCIAYEHAVHILGS